ncbi:hypothetical protein [Neobacillus niacini]|uniref:hypothetical protein n=1 Tax=Neobacillus niacini TaxID=86668 RepID=UPI0005F037C4|nr:hypothetical protein [Neobacillus niacini]
MGQNKVDFRLSRHCLLGFFCGLVGTYMGIFYLQKLANSPKPFEKGPKPHENSPKLHENSPKPFGKSPKPQGNSPKHS